MVIVPSGYVQQSQLAADVEKAKTKLGPEAIEVSFRLDADSTGEPSIFFRIILADWATAEESLSAVTGRIATTLFNEIRPFENWGLHPYFNFGSSSELPSRRIA
ncbi:MAG: hypothetical protein U0Q16_19425 [Bryobacteraceae bacterium]